MRYFIGLFNFLLVSLCFSVMQVSAHEEHTKPQKANLQKVTLAISMMFDAKGNLWRASVKDGFVIVDKSSDMGKTFSKPVQVNPTAQEIGAEGEARPKIAMGPEGNIYVTWTQALKTPFSGYIWFARSLDQGKSFEKPMVVHQDRAEITHRFDALNVASNGNITVSWVDKRDLVAAKAANKPYVGAAIYYALSPNEGASFNVEQKLADYSCECCRITTTNKPDGTAVVLWRHVFEGGERDHMVAEIPLKPDQTPVAKRATFGHWKIDGCPHHGAALASGGEGKDWWGYHMAYFDGKDNQPGLYYSRMDGLAWTSSPPMKLGNNANQAGHPAILSMGERVWLVWRESASRNNMILGLFSDDGGKHWRDLKIIANAADKADYPQLLAKDNQAYLAWNASKEGLRLIKLQE